MKNLKLKLVPAQPPAPRADADAAIRKYAIWFVLFITGLAVGWTLAHQP
jgi:hypothetical protein